MMNRMAVYPGTFDPLTSGHFDLIKRSNRIFPRLIVAVAAFSTKGNSMFSLDERMEMISEAIQDMPNVSVEPLDCLLVDFCRRNQANVVIRGLRAYSDFEYEFQMALINRRLEPELETFFMMPQEEHSYVMASTVREIARYGGDTSSFVLASVQRHVIRFMEAHPEQRLDAPGGRADVSGAFDR